MNDADQFMKSIAIFTVILLACLANPLRATGVMQHYDLDSLSYLSTAIVRAQVIGVAEPFKTADGNCSVNAIKVLDVFKGPLKPGDSIRIDGLDAFHRLSQALDPADPWESLQSGDIVYLFLAPNGTTGYAMYRLTDAKYTVIESGARLQKDDRVYSFGQYFPNYSIPTPVMRYAPGGMVPMTDDLFPGAKAMTRTDFETRLRQCHKSIDQMNQLLAADPTPQLGDQIMQLVRQRNEMLKRQMGRDDKLSEKLIQKAAGIAKPEDLLQLSENSSWSTAFEAEDALHLPAHRTYLLERAADKEETTQRRAHCAGILADSVRDYLGETASAAQSGDKKPAPDFLTRLSILAAANLGNEVGDTLLDQIVANSENTSWTDPAVQPDGHNAIDVLTKAFPTAKPLDQYRIGETLMHVSRDAYKSVLPRAGNSLTLVQPAHDFDAAMSHRKFHLDCSYTNQLIFAAIGAKPTIILHSMSDGTETELPIESTNLRLIYRFTFGSCSIEASIPDKAVGKYRVFLRDHESGRGRGDGIGFEIDIPQKSPIT
jgi:hypothetical protein